MIGNTVYVRTNSPTSAPSGTTGGGGFYSGIIGGSSITFTPISGMAALYDMATCPVCNTNSITVSVSSGTVNCYTPTASVGVTVSTVLSPVSYSWSGPGLIANTATNAVASVTSIGTYTCMINAGGCPPLQPATQTLVTITVSTNTVPTLASVSPTGAICPLPSAQLFSFPNSASYSSSWSGPGIVSAGNSPTVNINVGGIYTVVVTNTVNGCFDTKTLSVLPAPSLTLSLSSNTLCAQNLNGSPNTLTLTAGGALNYTLLSSSNFSTANANATVFPITLLPPFLNTMSLASATLVGFDGSCTNTITSTFSILPNPTLTLSPASSSICYGTSQNMSASGAQAYTWSPSGSLNTSAGVNVIASPTLTTIYSVIGNSQGCYSNAQTESVTVLPLPLINLTPVSPGICLNTTSVTLTANGTGTSFTWTPQQGLSSGSGQFVIASPTVTKTYTVLAALNGCTASASSTVSVVPPPSLTVALSSNTLCEFAFNGSPNTITLTSSGALTYTLETPNHLSNPNPNGPTSPIASQPPFNSGVATATLSGSNGVCTVSTSVSFSIIPNPTITVSSPTPVICAGQTFTYTNQGATSYTWGSGTPGITTYSTGQVAVANPSITSVFSVYGGSLGCNSAIQTTTITVNPLPTVGIVPGTPTVCLYNSIGLNATGNANTYTWSPFIALNSQSGSSVIASPSSQQSYTLIGSLNSCTSSAMITVSVLPLPSPSLIVSKPQVCLNEEITLEGFGGTSYDWYLPLGIHFEGSPLSFTANNTFYSGIYTLTATDINGCKASTSTVIAVYSLPDGDLRGSKLAGCVPFSSEFVFYSSGTTKAQWQLNSEIFKENKFSYQFTKAGDYLIKGNLRDTITTCVNTKTILVNAFEVPVADFKYSPEKPVEGLDEVLFTNNSKGSEQIKWNWYFVNNSGYRSQNENTNYLFENAGLYPIAFTVLNKWGCSDTVVKSIYIENDFNLFVPNAFTPNEDGLNDVFLPITRGVRLYELSIFDRWGARIFTTTDQQSGWDGYYKGQASKNDVYTWRITLTTTGAEAKSYTGSVLLSR